MAKCRLGDKKRKKLERLLGVEVWAAFVRGGWPHNHVEVYLPGINEPLMFDRNTGEQLSHPWFGKGTILTEFLKARESMTEPIVIVRCLHCGEDRDKCGHKSFGYVNLPPIVIDR